VFAGKHANYIQVHPQADGSQSYENTFIVGSWVPAAQRVVHQMPMLVTYNSSSSIAEPQGLVDNSWAHPQLNPFNFLWAILLQFVQGRDNQYFCGSYATPGNGHDLSFISGLAAAECLGATYPFDDNREAKADFERLKTIMGL
jgi:predicted NAD/FAD-binding protein